MSTLATPLSLDDPYLASELADADQGAGSLHVGVLVFTAAQMAILVTFAAVGYPGGALGGMAAVLPKSSMARPYSGQTFDCARGSGVFTGKARFSKRSGS